MKKFILIFSFATALTLTATSQISQDRAVFLDQTKAVKAKIEWNREIVAKSAGSIAIKITVKEGGKFSVLLLTDEDYQVSAQAKESRYLVPTSFRVSSSVSESCLNDS